jgi:putative restriction endonuclease
MPARLWTKDELKLAFHLYCQLPFGRLHSRNPKIIELANLIGRTPSSVAMKLVNFASLDPDITGTGRKGLGNASELDRQVWSEFNAGWERLALECEEILAKRGAVRLRTIDDAVVDAETNYEGETRAAVVQARVRQGFFRATVLASYDVKCCMTGLAVPELLVASHIVPWAADKRNRLNPRNGLCLSSLHDRALDGGLITVTQDHRIRISKRLLKSKDNWLARKALCELAGKKIELPARFYPHPEFLRYHEREVFGKNQ